MIWKKTEIEWNKKKSMTVVMCSKGYPGKIPKKNVEIKKFRKYF